MSTVATDGDDVLTGTKGADEIYGGDGSDIINSGAGDDLVDGGNGDDKLNAGSGDDTLIGGDGNDQLNGGGGSDTFWFNFTILKQPGEDITLAFRDGNIPNGSASATSFGNYLDQLGDWRDDQQAAYGGDLDTTLVDSVTFTGSTTQVTNKVDAANNYDSETWSEVVGNTLYVDNEYTYGTEPVLEITDSDGYDTIVSFQDAGPNVDKIVLNGLANLGGTELDLLFDITTVDTNNDGVHDASLLTWGGGSITIGGTTQWGTDVLSFFYDDQVCLM